MTNQSFKAPVDLTDYENNVVLVKDHLKYFLHVRSKFAVHISSHFCRWQCWPWEYTKGLLWQALNLFVRGDAFKENDGPAIVFHWRMDMSYMSKGHNKYMILGHQLLAYNIFNTCSISATFETGCEWYPSLMAHQHQKGHTVPKQVYNCPMSLNRVH